jgi:hypothetical protein
VSLKGKSKLRYIQQKTNFGFPKTANKVCQTFSIKKRTTAGIEAPRGLKVDLGLESELLVNLQKKN